MKPPWECRCTMMVGEKITRLTSGNTADRVAPVFDFRMGREREGPKQFLGDFEGILQTDGYGARDRIGGKGIVHAACWAHARRKFLEAVKLNPKDQTSIRIVAQINGLFAIDAQARQESLSLMDRHVLRLEKTKPLLEQVKETIQAARGSALPKSALAKTCDYTLTLWSLLSLALLYRVQRQYGKAEPLFDRALAILGKALGPEHPRVATCLENYAFLLRKMRRPEEAKPLEARARAIRAKNVLSRNPGVEPAR
jgi:tetratricopeptide (TPR) repeat protein